MHSNKRLLRSGTRSRKYRQELGLFCLLEAHGLTGFNRKNRQKPEDKKDVTKTVHIGYTRNQ